MSDDNILPFSPTGTPSAEEGGIVKPWGFVAPRPQPMLALRLRTGRTRSLAYHDLVGTDWDGHLLTLYAYHCTITIEGKGLAYVADMLTRQTMRLLIEQHTSPLLADQEDAYIHRITFGRPALEQLAE